MVVFVHIYKFILSELVWLARLDKQLMDRYVMKLATSTSKQTKNDIYLLNVKNDVHCLVSLQLCDSFPTEKKKQMKKKRIEKTI